MVGNADFKEFIVMMSQEFGRLVEQTIRGMWQRHPVTATFMGIHDHDDRLDDLTPEALRAAAGSQRSLPIRKAISIAHFPEGTQLYPSFPMNMAHSGSSEGGHQRCVATRWYDKGC